MSAHSRVGADEFGSLLPMTAALVFVALLVVALVSDIALVHGEYRSTASMADAIAEAGAGFLDEGRMHLGVLAIDADRSVAYAADLATDLGLDPSEVTFTVDGSSFCVSIRRTHRAAFLGSIGGSDQLIEVESCSVPASG
ncbi:MAG TPA: hypothetical protein VLA29_00070 [Acidimicrobiia bacterium]|nr:hypothetical protein [Acidimicrobiia bacterium]